jgi:hypothetical protein
MDYQSERGGRVVFQDIAKPPSMEWGSPLEAMEAVLELEKTVGLSGVFYILGHKFLQQHRRLLVVGNFFYTCRSQIFAGASCNLTLFRSYPGTLKNKESKKYLDCGQCCGFGSLRCGSGSASCFSLFCGSGSYLSLGIRTFQFDADLVWTLQCSKMTL